MRSGLNPSLTAGGATMASVPKDATSNIYTPLTLADWTTTLAVAGITSGNPGSAWSMQETSGNLADSIGARTFTQLGTAPTYAQTVPGWTRKGLTFTETATMRFSTSTPAANIASALVIVYVRLTGAPTFAHRSIIEYPSLFAEATATPRFQANGGSNTEGTVNPGTTVHALVMKSNVTALSSAVITEAEVIPCTWYNDGGTALILGGATNTPAPFQVLWGVGFSGAPAELTNAQIKTLLQTLGWTVAW
jgi:hypothetical protein